MNILGDFIKRVDSLYPVDIDNEELNALLTTIQNQGTEIEELHKELAKAQTKLEKIKAAEKKEGKATAKSAAEKRQRPRLLPKSLLQRKQLKRLLNNIGSFPINHKKLPLIVERKAFLWNICQLLVETGVCNFYLQRRFHFAFCILFRTAFQFGISRLEVVLDTGYGFVAATACTVVIGNGNRNQQYLIPVFIFFVPSFSHSVSFQELPAFSLAAFLAACFR